MRLCAVLVSLLLSLPVMGYELREDSQGVAVKWGPRAAFVLDQAFAAKLKDPRAVAAVQAALDALSAAAPAVELSLSTGHSAGLGYDTAPGAKNQSDIVGLEDWPYAASNLAATVVTLNVRTHEIIDADIAFNLEQWTFAVLDGGDDEDHAARRNDLQNTITHELGHALGLLHNNDDRTAVMYPSAPPGETSKRRLGDDDRAGLGALYAARPPEPLPVTGCSASGGGVQLAAAAVVLGCLARARKRARGRRAAGGVTRHASESSPRVRRLVEQAPHPDPLPVVAGRGSFSPAPAVRRLALAALALLPCEAGAGAPAPRPAEVRDAVVVGEVAATSSSWARPGLIVTDVQVTVKACDSPPCEAHVTYRVPGGRVGDLEQVVSHSPVPRRGDAVVMTWKRGRLSVASFSLLSR